MAIGKKEREFTPMSEAFLVFKFQHLIFCPIKGGNQYNLPKTNCCKTNKRENIQLTFQLMSS